jgi:hypothetical protein
MALAAERLIGLPATRQRVCISAKWITQIPIASGDLSRDVGDLSRRILGDKISLTTCHECGCK